MWFAVSVTRASIWLCGCASDFGEDTACYYLYGAGELGVGVGSMWVLDILSEDWQFCVQRLGKGIPERKGSEGLG